MNNKRRQHGAKFVLKTLLLSYHVMVLVTFTMAIQTQHKDEKKEEEERVCKRNFGSVKSS